jgi:hypothetical protein
LQFDFSSSFTSYGSTVAEFTASLNEKTPKPLEALLYEHRDNPRVAAAAGAVAVSCLLAATDMQLDPRFLQTAQRLLLRRGAIEAADRLAAVVTGGGRSESGSDSEGEDDSAAAGGTEEEGPSAADLLRLAPTKASECELLTQLSFQMVMAKELLTVARQL